MRQGIWEADTKGGAFPLYQAGNGQHGKGRGAGMISGYKFKEVSVCDYFHEEIPNPIYFPVTDSEGLPCRIREKAEGIIDGLIKSYETENRRVLDLTKLYLDVRVEIYFNNEKNPVCGISVIIASHETEKEVWLSGEHEIKQGDNLYKPFRKYFMEQAEKCLFGGQVEKES